MRSGWIVLGFLALGAVACRRAAPADRPDAGEVTVRGATDAGGVPVLTDAQLDAYLRYQRAMLPVYDQLFRDLERLSATGAKDAGAGGLPPSVKVVEARALAEEAARTDAGLTEAELAWIEPMVIDVISARSLARSLDATAQLKELEAMREQVEGDVREGLDNTLAELRAQQDAGQRLAEQRARYGDPNVDRLLAREAELIQNHEAWMARLTGGRR